MELVVSERELLIAVALTAIVYLTLLLIALVRRPWRATPAQSILSADIYAEMAELRQRVEMLELAHSQRAESSVGVPDDPVYASADRLIKQGVAAEEVAGRLGLSRAEVDLIAVLQRDKGGASQ